MPAIAALASATITIAAGDSLIFLTGGAGIAALQAGSTTVRTFQLGGSLIAVGPFDGPRTLTVSAERTLTYSAVAALLPSEPRAGVIVGTPADQVAFGGLVSGGGNPSRTSTATNKQTSPWTRLFGPNELNAWNKSAELSSAVSYVTAQSPAGGPAMFRREGASVLINGALMSANYGNINTNAAAISQATLVNSTLAVLVYIHRANANTHIYLRLGTSSANYVLYRWRSDYNLIQEGWNLLLTNTAEPIGALSSPYGQSAYQTGTFPFDGWLVGAGSFAFGAGGTVNYMAVEVQGLQAGTNNSYCYVEGIYAGGKSKPRVTIGFDVQTAGLDLAKSIMDKYGLRGYAAVPTSNGNQAAPQYLWQATDEARLQGLHNAGWDILQHSASHNAMGNFSDRSMIKNEIESCREQINRIGTIGAADLLATPNGSSSNRVVSVAAQSGVKWIRNVNNSPMLQSDGLVGWINPWAQGAMGFAMGGLTNQQVTDRAINYIELLKLYGVCGHMFSHAILSAPTSIDTQDTVFDAICAKLAAEVALGNIEVVTPSELMRGNLTPNLDAVLASPSRLAITLGASPYAVFNTGYQPMRYLISGGTVSAIDASRDGATFDVTGMTAGVFELAPGDRLRITYTVVPTVIQLSI